MGRRERRSRRTSPVLSEGERRVPSYECTFVSFFLVSLIVLLVGLYFGIGFKSFYARRGRPGYAFSCLGMVW